MKFTILHYDVLESTNDEALNQAARGADEGLCVVAKQQTRGRGRYGRVWNSPPDAGIYFSLLLRPTVELKFLPLITLMTAVAVHDALEKTFALDCDIKWVNDIHVNGKKISGILAETTETTKGLAVVVGIGINLTSENFSPELIETAASIKHETGKTPDINLILENLTDKISDFYNILQQTDGAAQIREEWARRSSYANGKKVKVILGNEILIGETSGIEENGALRVQTADGECRIISAGEVSQVRKIDQ